MKSSKKDIFILHIWLKLMGCYVFMFITSVVLPIAAMFPNLGFPCYYNTLVDYSKLNLREKNQAQHLTPTLFLEAPEMFFYVTYSFIVDCCSLVYYALAAVAVVKAKKHAPGLMALSQWIMAVGSPTLLYMAVLKLWTIQLYIHTLSYKHIYLAAFVYCLHWLLSMVYTECYITNVSSQWTSSELKKTIPENILLYRVVHVLKPIMMNVHLSVVALETLIFCLSFMMAIGNSFYVMVSDIVFGAINLYLILPIIWYFVTEFWLSKYLPRQFGFYFGVLVASIILILPVVRYDKIFVAAQIHRAVSINIAMIPLCALVALLVRACRVYTDRKKIAYTALPSKPQTIKYTKPIEPSTKQAPDSSIFLEEESDTDFEQ
ncbi:integral membrane protein [Alcelaphine gammaherpesvirus 1]|uniref:Envelope glycoprotein M n=1 Tax=Alcelaphine herpesvirus 1 (strain C500) TaxID=654901 RepID=GM_ALHV1|nr:integral membrane protein [Alcelaphine gammaherpesvirus 1]O36388.1 RecName: Full=Envelope glycoprotein M; Short=gM [Alcelaphine herpesvirus 1 strain C500]AAC58085.1 integral membrane protein [Alcelaphine gammaherpesvirus 1]APB09464.1 envelope glycoprotein M [Alcelaphine gammaherpesvirus 1]APB09536.1 envelope glycoprotein M [Alcelaphine gammaherpesvirus 1]ATI21927.1 ORF39 [Alcelaphine gammaherpesvirus 1]QDY92272.1 envelope glycoprotein M [Alcelaphine gammaherpesvirus 1]